ncbi:hypothetical protein ACLOJK_000086 [Asimina triloba]
MKVCTPPEHQVTVLHHCHSNLPTTAAMAAIRSSPPAPIKTPRESNGKIGKTRFFWLITTSQIRINRFLCSLPSSFFIIAIQPLIHVASCRRRNQWRSMGALLLHPRRQLEAAEQAGGPTVTPIASCRGEKTNQRQARPGVERAAGCRRASASQRGAGAGCQAGEREPAGGWSGRLGGRERVGHQARRAETGCERGGSPEAACKWQTGHSKLTASGQAINVFPIPHDARCFNSHGKHAAPSLAWPTCLLHAAIKRADVMGEHTKQRGNQGAR